MTSFHSSIIISSVCSIAILDLSIGSPLTLKTSSPLTRREGPARGSDEVLSFSDESLAVALTDIGNVEVPKRDKVHRQSPSLLSVEEKRSNRSKAGLLPQSLPLNGNFEDGTAGQVPNRWGATHSTPAVLSAEEYHGGHMSLKIQEDHEIVSGWAADSCFEVEAGVKYVLTFWAKSPTADSGLITMFPVYANFQALAFRRALVTTDNSFQMFHTIPVSANWSKFSHEFTANEDSAKVRLLIGGTGGTIYLDDISFQEECADTVNVYGAESTQSTSMGTFTRLDKDKSGFPIYKNEHDQYLYFWGDFDSWLIGPDYHSEESNLQSPNSISQDCPTMVSGTTWSVKSVGEHTGTGTFRWISLPLTLEKVAR